MEACSFLTVTKLHAWLYLWAQARPSAHGPLRQSLRQFGEFLSRHWFKFRCGRGRRANLDRIIDGSL
ncbi:hypothetical protein [Olivibacter sitiensis]|uniref:hypothetical protein n=1 Tax=Olivibacter sitiensis TaxID=376470 RepID=UPI00146FAA92|nr:hypothetical protein [Olivibacter sitiensis]